MLVDTNDYNKYKYESVVFGPWIVYNKIIDTQKANVYRVEQGTPHPYIIYKDKLYLADDFNFILYHYKEVKYSLAVWGFSFLSFYVFIPRTR